MMAGHAMSLTSWIDQAERVLAPRHPRLGISIKRQRRHQLLGTLRLRTLFGMEMLLVRDAFTTARQDYC